MLGFQYLMEPWLTVLLHRLRQDIQLCGVYCHICLHKLRMCLTCVIYLFISFSHFFHILIFCEFIPLLGAVSTATLALWRAAEVQCHGFTDGLRYFFFLSRSKQAKQTHKQTHKRTHNRQTTQTQHTTHTHTTHTHTPGLPYANG